MKEVVKNDIWLALFPWNFYRILLFVTRFSAVTCLWRMTCFAMIWWVTNWYHFIVLTLKVFDYHNILMLWTYHVAISFWKFFKRFIAEGIQGSVNPNQDCHKLSVHVLPNFFSRIFTRTVLARDRPGFHQTPQIVTNVLCTHVSKLVSVVKQREFQKLRNVLQSDCKIKAKLL